MKSCGACHFEGGGAQSTREGQPTWQQLIVVCYAQEKREVIADITPLRVHQDVPAKAAARLMSAYIHRHSRTVLAARSQRVPTQRRRALTTDTHHL